MFLNIKGAWLRIAGQAIAFFTLIFIVIFLVEEKIPDFSFADGSELLLLIPLFAFTIIGYVLAYFLPSKGGAMLIIGGALMMLCHLLFANYSAAIFFGLPFIIAGVLTLIAIKKPSPKREENKIPKMENAETA